MVTVKVRNRVRARVWDDQVRTVCPHSCQAEALKAFQLQLTSAKSAQVRRSLASQSRTYPILTKNLILSVSLSLAYTPKLTKTCPLSYP